MVTNAINSKLNFEEWLIDSILIVVLLGIFYAAWIGSYPLFTPDEGRYSEIAREMVISGDYITPRSNGVIFMDKPILYYWLQAIAINMFGLKEWALRFWPASIGVLGCFVVYITGRLLFNRQTGILSATILAINPLYYGASHYANLDIELAVFISNSLLFFITSLRASFQTKRIIYAIGAYFFAGLAILTKGLMGLVFPMAIIGIWIVLLRRWQTFQKLNLMIGMAIILGIAAPWYIIMQKTNPDFFYFFFYVQHVLRFFSAIELNSKEPFWFYVPVLIAGFFPWSLFFLQSSYQKIRNIYNAGTYRETELFLLVWMFFIFIFFTVQTTKTLGYILLMLPAMSLFVGSYFSTLWNDCQSSKGYRLGIQGIILLCCFIAIILPIATYFPSLEVFKKAALYLNALAIISLAMGITIFFVRKKNVLIIFICLAMTTGVFLLMLSVSAKALNYKTIKPLSVQIKPYLKENDEIVSYSNYYFDLPIYLNVKKNITVVSDWSDSSRILKRDNWRREFLYGMPYQNAKNWLINEDIFWQRWHSNHRLIVFLNQNQYTAFKVKTKSKIFFIAQYNGVMVVSNQVI
jgi:4-amino-4-deoxy-L-arabinose transferase-like glycosyltransferase